MHDRDGVENRQVVACQCGRDLIDLDRCYCHANGRHGQSIRANSATEVSDVGHARSRKTPRMQGRNPKAGGLLQSGFGKQHALGKIAKFCDGLGAQFCLGQHGRHECRGMTGTTQAGNNANDVCFVGILRQGVQKSQAVWSQEFS